MPKVTAVSDHEILVWMLWNPLFDLEVSLSVSLLLLILHSSSGKPCLYSLIKQLAHTLTLKCCLRLESCIELRIYFPQENVGQTGSECVPGLAD